MLPASGDEQDLSLAEHAYRCLLDEIRTGLLRSGQRVKEKELALRLHVSRTPIREAIRRLVAERLIEGAPSRGMVITTLDRQRVRELYDLRESLEGTAARMAARHASPSDLATMRDFLEAGDAARRPEDSARLNRLLHEAIRDAAHNRYLSEALVQLSNSLALLPGTTFEVARRTEEAQREHAAIVRAIEAGDSESAEAQARLHIANAGQARRRMMFGAA